MSSGGSTEGLVILRARPSITLTVTYVAVLSLEACASVFLNMFIAFVIGRDYHIKKSLTPLQKILAALTTSSTLFIIVSSFNVLSHLLMPDLSGTKTYSYTITLLFLYSMCSSTYLTAVLCFYYFIKVVNVQSGFLGRIKNEISSIVPWQIGLVNLLSLCNTLFSLLLFTSPQSPVTNGSSNLPPSVSSESLNMDYGMGKMLVILTVLPLLCTVISTLLTIGFLKFHSDKMEKAQTSGEAGLALYKHVINKMLRFLILYFVFYLVVFLYNAQVFTPYSPGYYLVLMLMFLFTPIQSALHILDNQYLRSSWREMIGRIMPSTHRNA